MRGFGFRIALDDLPLETESAKMRRGELDVAWSQVDAGDPGVSARRLPGFLSWQGEVAFEFVDGTNMPSPAAGHMHAVRIRLVDPNHLETVWSFYQNGKPAMTERTQYVKVKS